MRKTATVIIFLSILFFLGEAHSVDYKTQYSFDASSAGCSAFSGGFDSVNGLGCDNGDPIQLSTTNKDTNFYYIENLESNTGDIKIESNIDASSYDCDGDGCYWDTEVRSGGSWHDVSSNGGTYSFSQEVTKYRFRGEMDVGENFGGDSLYVYHLTIKVGKEGLCTSRGLRNECIVDQKQQLDSKTYSVSSIFLTKKDGLITAPNGLSVIDVSNSSFISGTLRGSFELYTNELTLEPGTRLKPGKSDILLEER